MQNDDFMVADWGFSGVSKSEYPAWIQLDTENVSSEGIKLRVAPQEQDIDKTYTVYFILTDSNELRPKSSKFELKVLVVDPAEQIEKYRQKKFVVGEMVEPRKEKNIVVFEPIDREYTFKI